MIEWYASEGWIYVYGVIGGVALRLVLKVLGIESDGTESPFDFDGGD